MSHEELCERALRWLRGTRRCNPVFSRCASCSEIPDAIGWSSAHGWRGSTVIECKTSLSDFHADKKKRYSYRHKEFGHLYRGRDWRAPKLKEMCEYERVENALMGDYRIYFCLPGVITPAMVEEHAPDHGLLYADGRKMRIVRPAPRRELVNRECEIWFLRFAIINGKENMGIPH